METLSQYPDLNIVQVAGLLNCTAQELREEQLDFLRSKLKRTSELWNIKSYGR